MHILDRLSGHLERFGEEREGSEEKQNDAYLVRACNVLSLKPLKKLSRSMIV